LRHYGEKDEVALGTTVGTGATRGKYPSCVRGTYREKRSHESAVTCEGTEGLNNIFCIIMTLFSTQVLEEYLSGTCRVLMYVPTLYRDFTMAVLLSNFINSSLASTHGPIQSTACPPVACVRRVHTQPPSTIRSETESPRSYGPYRRRKLEDETEYPQSPSTIRPPGPELSHSHQTPFHHQEVYHHINPGSSSLPPSPQSPHHPGHSPTEYHYPQRTAEGVCLQVSRSIAARAIRKAELMDGSKVSVVFTLNTSQDKRFLHVVVGEIRAS